MLLKDLNVLVVDDDVYKSNDIKKALVFNYIYKITIVDNQADVWKLLDGGTQFDLIVTDMQHPLEKDDKCNEEAGFILIEKMKERGINIPVIICSSGNYVSKDVLGTVWYSPLNDLGFEFKEVLGKLK